MTTEKYDLHTTDYSVQGWDAIMATDMEKLDDMIPTRIIGTLGEMVVAYETLYLSLFDNKWYKALANGVEQPCLGLAVEGGVLNGEIRIHRMGEIENLAWSWGGGPIYLSDLVAGGLTESTPASNAQLIGYGLSATKMLVMIESGLAAGGSTAEILSRGGTILSPSEAINVIVWRAPFACTVTNVRGYRVGGTGATINARLNGASNHLAAALSLTNADEWMDGGAVQNAAYAEGDKLEIMIVSVTGSPTQVAVQVDFTITETPPAS